MTAQHVIFGATFIPRSMRSPKYVVMDGKEHQSMVGIDWKERNDRRGSVRNTLMIVNVPAMMGRTNMAAAGRDVDSCTWP